MSSKSTRSSISPFRSRRAPTPPSSSSRSGARPTTPSSSGGRPTTPSSLVAGRPTTPSSLVAGRPTTPLSSSSSTSAARLAKVSPVATSNVSPPSSLLPDPAKSKENVTVTVRFRPLSAREINKGDEVAWYADGDNTVRNEYNQNIAYGFDKVFGPATTTRHVYDIAAQHVVGGAMEGINGTVFAYGVTSSGKTHTMHGEQKSPGIIPLAVKDVFSIIQDTPGREFLLRVSYLEIYNEVINDLLDPTGQNLRIREDSQGTYVEGIKEEVVLSPAHALSLIASGEEHRHVGSNNFNLLSSRSHTIFTLVIAKLTDGKATHVPYRDSKLTRLLQSSLSGHGRISLICTITPASSNSEETHNTLKFAHRSKYVEIKASQNKIMDEKSLIKKYQREISCLKEELQQLKRGMMVNPYMVASNQEDLVNLKLKLEAGQVKLQSRLEEEEEAKAALMGRIQRLTKLILVSTKNTISSSVSEKPGHRRRHSFGEDELVYLPDRKRDLIDDDAGSFDSDLSAEGKLASTNFDEPIRFDRRSRRRGMLGWFKLRKPDQFSGLSPSVDSESSAGGSPSSSQSSQQKHLLLDLKDGKRKSVSIKGEDPSTYINSFPERTQAGDLFSAAPKGRRLLPTGTTIIDQIDLLREQVKMLAGEVALCTSSLKRLSEQAANNPEDLQIQEQMQKLKDEINEKKLQMRVLEQRMVGSYDSTDNSSNNFEMPQRLAKLAAQLSEKTFELEIMSADNRILQDQLQAKAAENAELQESITLLRQQVSNLSDKARKGEDIMITSTESSETNGNPADGASSSKRAICNVNTAASTVVFPSVFSNMDSKESPLKSQVLMQAAEIENLKQEKLRLAEEKDGLEIHSQKLSEEASYAKELAAAAAVELKNLAEEVTKLSYENAKLNGELAASKELAASRGSIRNDVNSKKTENGILLEELQKELVARCQREASLEVTLSEKVQREAELQKRIDDAKRREQGLENELANMWVLVAKIKKNGNISKDNLSEGLNDYELKSRQYGFHLSNLNADTISNGVKVFDSWSTDDVGNLEEIRASYEYERRHRKELESIVSRLKGEDLTGLDSRALEELQNFHVEALSKICQEKMTNRNL
ncbi:kinesin-like protein KIN-7E, chloroplastic isoform X2 [Typha latifolia]|uniref:kinesin-like protein KIN-7E, chloroplastic isoform X2 n=1 Tax=Typha latifolia TaxID=4733 RepID=UPI003C2BC344